jgi:TPP-dependent 2-oxoacid decarboxylase
MENKTTNNTQWTFVPVKKERVIKATETYVLINLATFAQEEHHISVSTIISSKFKRQKETEDTIFLSIPENFKLRIKKSMWDRERKKYVDEFVGEISPSQLKEKLDNLIGKPLPEDLPR